jgi:hypothetical protein
MDTSKILAELHAERERLNQAIAALEALNGTAVSSQLGRTTRRNAAAPTQQRAKRVISAEARQRMAKAQRKRWADHKKAAKAPAPKK